MRVWYAWTEVAFWSSNTVTFLARFFFDRLSSDLQRFQSRFRGRPDAAVPAHAEAGRPPHGTWPRQSQLWPPQDRHPEQGRSQLGGHVRVAPQGWPDEQGGCPHEHHATCAAPDATGCLRSCTSRRARRSSAAASSSRLSAATTPTARRLP